VLTTGLSGIAGLAALIRTRLAEVWRSEALAAERTVIISAAEPFAPTSYARARLLRQMHACGLLSDQETEQAEALLGVAP
jgi:hypothetical protein